MGQNINAKLKKIEELRVLREVYCTNLCVLSKYSPHDSKITKVSIKSEDDYDSFDFAMFNIGESLSVEMYKVMKQFFDEGIVKIDNQIRQVCKQLINDDTNSNGYNKIETMTKDQFIAKVRLVIKNEELQDIWTYQATNEGNLLTMVDGSVLESEIDYSIQGLILKLVGNISLDNYMSLFMCNDISIDLECFDSHLKGLDVTVEIGLDKLYDNLIKLNLISK